MHFELIHIVFFVLTLVFAIVAILLYFRLKGATSRSEKRIKRITEKFNEDKIYLEKEIKRQNYILQEYKQKNGSKKESIETPALVSAEGNNQLIENTVNQTNIVSNRLADEDIDFKEKNKRLWDLSTAIHKEKERINKVKKEIEFRHAEVTKSITYAQRIQKALLPSSKILGVRFTDYFIFWKPRDIVSGDFYWFKRLEDSIIIVVADCTGHGVPGAFMSLLGISFLNDILNRDKTLKSNQILDRLREMIKLALQQEVGKKRMASDGMDMGICIINNKTMEMDFAGANNSLYLVRDEEIMVFKENRNPVGIHPFEKPFKNHEFKLERNDRIYLFSDGFIDQFGGKTGRKFLKNNFQRLLLHIVKQNLSMQAESELLEEVLDQWRGNQHPQVDDILILGLKI